MFPPETRGRSVRLTSPADQAGYQQPNDAAAVGAALEDGGNLDAIATGLTTIDGRVDGLEALATSLNGFVDGLETLVGATNALLTTQAGYLDGLETKLDSLGTAIGATDDAAWDGVAADASVIALLKMIATNTTP